jgi:selenocysteine-specific translation elongation factor
MCIDIYSPLSTCRKSKTCNNSSNHGGKCNSEKQSHKFWVNYPVYNLKASRAEVISQRREIQSREANLNQADYQISFKRQELEELAKYREEQASTAS